MEHTRGALSSLPETFFLGHRIRRSGHLEGFFNDPANLYDTFLHSHDRAYSVPQLYDWVESAGLLLNSFTSFD